MGGERQGPKGGRYVGGFFQFFDWNAKSRKKLFPSKSDLPENPKQGKQSEGNFPTTRICMVDEDEIGATTSIKGYSDYSCASSVTDEDGYGTKAPGVVARLMGLDSLPTSNALEPYSSPFSDTQSLREPTFRREELHFSYQEHRMVRSGNFLDTSEGLPRNTIEPKHQKLFNRPIEKFQSEMLPPRSAKSIPLTHHKLLSPIKNPGFVPSKDVAHIMEAAAKIIDAGPQAPARAKISSTGSPSVPLKVRELKERMEASQRLSRFSEVSHRALESNAAKTLKGKSLNKSWNGSAVPTFKASCSTTDVDSASTKNKGKSISLAIQAKVNVQKREGLSQSQKNIEGMKEEDALKQPQSSKSESSSHKVAHKKPSARTTSTVLRQNNQKQNCNSAKGNVPSKPSAANLHGRKLVSGDSFHGRQKNLYRDAGSSRVGSKKSSLEGRNKDIANTGARNVPRKKRSIDGNLQDVRSDGADTMIIGRNDKLSKSNSVADRHFPWPEEGRKNGTDVVSFTFTTPMTRPMGGLELYKQSADESRNKKAMLCPDSLKLSSPGFDVGVDSLSVLLEQKLRELTNGMDSSRCNFIKAEESSSSARQNAINVSAGSETVRFHDESSPSLELQMDSNHGRIFSSFSSTEPEFSRRRYDLQGRETDECSTSTTLETKQSYNFRLPSPVSILDPSGLTESCNSSDSTGTNMTEECKQHSSVQGDEDMLDSSYLGTIHQLETEKDLSDSASSVSFGTTGTKDDSCYKRRISKGSTAWELDYVKDIVCNVELMFNNCVSAKTSEIISPHLFDQLEKKQGRFSPSRDGVLLERKALFDCVSECLEWRCQLYVGGGSKAWAKGVAMMTRKERLAEEVYKEIQAWRSMKNSMVDELVDKDMSVQQGRWLDFELDEFELAVDIEAQIVDSLVDELVVDIIPFSRWSSNAAFFC